MIKHDQTDKIRDCAWFTVFVLFVWFDSLRPSQQSFSYVGTGLPGLNQYYARINVSCSMTRRSDAGEARNRGPLVSSSQCLNTKCGQSKRFGTGPGRVRVQTFWPNTQLPPIGIRAKIWAYTWVSEKFGHSNAKTQKTGHSYTFFIKKRGFIPGGAERGGIRAHIRTMSYIGSYPPPPPPPPPRMS